MEITKNEKKVLESLKENTVLLNYLNKLESWICDIRNGDFTPETRTATAKILKQYLIDKIKLNNVVNRSDNDFE